MPLEFGNIRLRNIFLAIAMCIVGVCNCEIYGRVVRLSKMITSQKTFVEYIQADGGFQSDCKECHIGKLEIAPSVGTTLKSGASVSAVSGQPDFKSQRGKRQLPGCAVFIPDGAGGGEVYIADKRKDNGISISNNLVSRQASFGNNSFYKTRFLNMSGLDINDADHTERQLIEQVLKDNIVAHPEMSGTILIYTQSAPCRDRNEDNGGYACVEYYKRLLLTFENLKIHIYCRPPYYLGYSFRDVDMFTDYELRDFAEIIGLYDLDIATLIRRINEKIEKNAELLEDAFNALFIGTGCRKLPEKRTMFHVLR